LVYGTFVHFYCVFGIVITQFLPNEYGTNVCSVLALVGAFLKMKNFNFGGKFL